MRDDRQPADEAMGGTVGGTDETHPAGEIRLSPARAIGLRVSALGGLAVGAIVAATPVLAVAHPTSNP